MSKFEFYVNLPETVVFAMLYFVTMYYTALQPCSSSLHRLDVRKHAIAWLAEVGHHYRIPQILRAACLDVVMLGLRSCVMGF